MDSSDFNLGLERELKERPELLAHRAQILPELDRPSGNVFAEHEQLANPLAAGRAGAVEFPHSGSVGAVSAGASLQNVGETRARIRDRAAIDPVAHLEQQHDRERRHRHQRRGERDGKEPQPQAGAFAGHENRRSSTEFQADTRRSPKNRYSRAPSARKGP